MLNTEHGKKEKRKERKEKGEMRNMYEPVRPICPNLPKKVIRTGTLLHDKFSKNPNM